MSAGNSIKVRQAHPHIGALVEGVDLACPQSPGAVATLVEAFNTYSVLIFRDQHINDEQQVAFSRNFGTLERTSFGNLAPNPYIYFLSNIDARGKVLAADAKKRTMLRVNARWHTDSSFKPIPALASVLSAREIPATERADTEFASMRVGYRTLPREQKDALRDLVAVHHYGYSLGLTGDGGVAQKDLDALPPVRHPVVRIHPGSGEPSLFVSGHIESIDGMSVDEGRRLAESLVDWCTRPDYVYSHEWREGDVVMWDNRCALHRASVVPLTEVRRAHRTTIAGEGPVEALAAG